MRALRALSLIAEPGECVAVLGASGCGKTTLLRVVAGLERPDAGQVFFDGCEVTQCRPQARGIGFVFQQDALFEHFRVAENVAFGLHARGIRAGSGVEGAVRSALARARAEHLWARPVGALSGGERQRVALARALVVEPHILLLDEPLSRLDAPLRAQLRGELAAIVRERAATTLYVTHDQREALGLGDRVAVMQSGRIEQIGTPRQIYERPSNTFVAQAVGMPAMALVPIEALGHSAPVAGARYGLRAQAVRLCESGNLRGVVNALDDLVEEAYVYVDVPAGSLVARVLGRRPYVGETVALAIDFTQAHRFGPDGVRLDASATPGPERDG